MNLESEGIPEEDAPDEWDISLHELMNPVDTQLDIEEDVVDPHRVRIGPSTLPGGGLGVFTRESLMANELVEIIPTLLVPGDVHSNSVLEDVAIVMDDGSPRLMLGFGTFYNHKAGDQANVRVFQSYKQPDILFMKAERDIRAGEELFMDYGDNYFTNRVRSVDNNLYIPEEWLTAPSKREQLRAIWKLILKLFLPAKEKGNAR